MTTTTSLTEARRWARELAQQNGQPYALYYRGHEGGRGTGQPWTDIFGVAPLSAGDPNATNPHDQPCEIYQPSGDAHMVTIF